MYSYVNRTDEYMPILRDRVEKGIGNTLNEYVTEMFYLALVRDDPCES